MKIKVTAFTASKTFRYTYFLYVFQCTTETLLDPDTPIYPGVKKGDGVNNDCDSAEGEEINNGLGMKGLTSWLTCL